MNANGRHRSGRVRVGTVVAVALIAMVAVGVVAAYVRAWQAEADAERQARAWRDAAAKLPRATLTTTRPAATAAATTAPSNDPAAADAATRTLIAQLSDPDYAVRSAAGRRLNSLGGEALPAVAAAVNSGTAAPEAQIRLEAAMTYLAPRARGLRTDAAVRDWVRRHMHAEYDALSQTDPAWDAEVHRAIDLLWRLGDDPLRGPADVRAAAVTAFETAVSRGCADPLVLCLYHLAIGDRPDLRASLGVRFELAERQLQVGKHSPLVLFWLAMRPVRGTRAYTADVWPSSARMLPAIAKLPGAPGGLLGSCVRQYVMTLEAHDGPTGDAWQRLADAYAEAAPGTSMALALKGKALVHAAWDARGDGWGSDVTPERWKAFGERLAEAEAALEAAWKADPADPMPPALMITVKMGQGEAGGGRPAMEEWFGRAMAANPDCLDACERKMRYLMPRWHGSFAEMIAFGRECLKTQNWRGGVPLMLVYAHEQAATEASDAAEYFARADVWADVSEVYEGALANFPEDALRRSEYARYATRAGRWAIAHQQFVALGDRALAAKFGGQESLDYLRAKAARLGGGQGKSE